MGFLKVPKFAQLSKPEGCLANYLMYKPISPHGAQVAVYPVIVCQARRRGINLADIAAHIGVSEKELMDKLTGKDDFSSEESKMIRARFFPDIELEALAWRAGGELWLDDNVEL